MSRQQRRAAQRQARKPAAPGTGPATGAASKSAIAQAFATASAHHKAGRLDAAEGLYRRILAADPGHIRALHNLGLIAHGRGDLATAEALIAKAIAGSEKVAAFHNSLGIVVRDRGDRGAALAAFRRAIALDPAYGEAHYNLGDTLQDAGDPKPAEASLNKALKLKPDFPEAHICLGNLYLDSGRLDEAVASYRRAVLRDPDNGEWLNNLGQALGLLGRLDEAIDCLQKAVTLHPGLAEAHNNLGNLYKDKGLFDRAEDHYARAIAAGDSYAEPYYNRSNLKRFEADDPAFAALEAMKAAPALDPQEAINLHFALGKMRGDIGDHEAAFDEYTRGNRLRKSLSERAGRGFDRRRHSARVDQIIDCFSIEFFKARRPSGLASEKPLLIVGMPRSGSSLIEQILSSHGDIFGGGELSDLGAVAMGLKGGFPAGVAALDDAALESHGRAYLDRLDALSPSAARVTDKMPDNFLLVGLVAAMLPGARFIDSMRSPLDVCLSCYFNNFTHGSLFSYDLADLAAYYRDYRRLMDHWAEVLPGAILPMAYESLIEDLEGASRRMITFCGLEWDERCLDFHKNDRPVRTASNVQTRQKIYSSSVERWRPYEKFLGPLIDNLN